MIAGASLSGGLASATSTWVAAFALTLLTQMLLILGLSAAMQYVVFGVAIIAGMVVSGDRVALRSPGPWTEARTRLLDPPAAEPGSSTAPRKAQGQRCTDGRSHG